MKKLFVTILFFASAAVASGAAATSPMPSPVVELAHNIVLVYEIKARATRCGFEDVDISYAEWQALMMDFSANYSSPEVDQTTLLGRVRSSEEFVDQAIAKDGCDAKAASLHQSARDYMAWLLTEMDAVYSAAVDGRAGPGQLNGQKP